MNMANHTSDILPYLMNNKCIIVLCNCMIWGDVIIQSVDQKHRWYKNIWPKSTFSLL